MQKGGSQYGVPPPEMATFGTASVARPPMVVNIQTADASSPRQSNFEELATTVTGSYPEEDPLAGGEEVERGVSGNRWPRRETVALLKIRSDMDATFRDATLKGPLWEEVSRKLAEQGYTRSAKKCKEKFENVHKYYKRTKDSRASRPDGKSYRFFSQLEALHNASSSSSVAAAANTAVSSPITNTATAAANPATTLAMTGAQIQQPTPISSIPPAPPPSAAAPVPPVDPPAAAAGAGLSALGAGVSFSSNTSESESETEDEDTEEGPREQRKRKREGGGRGGRSKKMVAFFEGLMKQVIERQEAMQQKFLETIERREQDRMIREEAWRRQEIARLSREQEAIAQERVNAASRDATIISFLQKITGQTIQLPQTVPIQAAPSPQSAAVVQTAPAPPPQLAPTPSPPPPRSQTHSQPQSQPQSHLQPQQQPPQPQPHLQPQQQQPPQPQSQLHPQQQPRQPQQTPSPRQHAQPESAKPSPIEMGPTVPQELQQQQVPQEPETQALVTASGSEPASSRWPKAEVHALINIRAGMESRYQEAGPKGPLWEEISAAMKQLGYGRNAKRCKEKWENINKYFKKVKESNRKRPEDAKTCPYFHQLDALYRNKVLGGGGGGGEGRSQQQDPDPNVLPITTLPPPSSTGEGASSKSIVNPKGAPAAGQARSSNGGLPPPTSFVQDASSTATDLMKKPEDIVKELMEQRHHHRYDYDRMGEDTEDDEEEDDDGMDEEEQKMAYKIEFQRRSMPSTSTSNANGNKARTASPTDSFFAMVHQ